MDANGQGFWLLGDASHWRALDHVRWDASCRALCLASERSLPAPADPAAAHAAANSALERIPRALDDSDGVAYWHTAELAVVARSHLPGEAIRLPLSEAPSDLAVGHDGVLYALVGGGVHLHDLRGRWSDVVASAAGFVPWRCAADPDGGLWLLERASGRLARLTGSPMTVGPYFEYDGRTFRPDPENCREPRIDVLADPVWPSGERPLALAWAPQRGPALLSWNGGDGIARLRFWDVRAQRLGDPYELVGARYAYALAFTDAQRAVVRVPGLRDAPAFDLPDAARVDAAHLLPCGEIYPLAADALEAPFAHRLDGAPRYPCTLTDPAPSIGVADGERGARALHRLSLSNLARQGEARHYDADGQGVEQGMRLIDSGEHRTVWHRLYAEARLPARTGLVVWCAATAEPVPPSADDPNAWAPHRFGDVPAAIGEGNPQMPGAVRESAPSELPHHTGVASWAANAPGAGLYSVLIQQPRQRVRRLTGRYLWIRVAMNGDGRVGPELAALRAWSSRFSYRDHYLPRLYHEDRHGTAATAPGQRVDELEALYIDALDDGGSVDGGLRERLQRRGLALGATARIEVERAGKQWRLEDGESHRSWHLREEPTRDGQSTQIAVYRPQATPADFLERLLCNFEGVLTPLEDRIANAHLLTDPATVPDAQLEWLGAWIGVAFDPALPASRRRNWLANAPRLARMHGTRRGLELALDIASHGGVSGGEIIVLEDFRLRRLMATLLGVDLDVDDDPLLPGLMVSGNSVVGDALLLGEAERTELMALFRAESATDSENDRIQAFYGRLAHRATVLVHRDVEAVDLGLLHRIVELETPAHAQVRVVTATWPFLVGVASLVGVDTYLGPRPQPRPARVQVSTAGRGDFVRAPATLDPRVQGQAAPPPTPPVADAGNDLDVGFGESFELDGSGSTAAPGRHLQSYLWRRLPPS